MCVGVAAGGGISTEFFFVGDSHPAGEIYYFSLEISTPTVPYHHKNIISTILYSIQGEMKLFMISSSMYNLSSGVVCDINYIGNNY